MENSQKSQEWETNKWGGYIGNIVIGYQGKKLSEESSQESLKESRQELHQRSHKVN